MHVDDAKRQYMARQHRTGMLLVNNEAVDDICIPGMKACTSMSCECSVMCMLKCRKRYCRANHASVLHCPLIPCVWCLFTSVSPYVVQYARREETNPKHVLRGQAPEHVMLMGMWKMLLSTLIRTQGTNTMSVTPLAVMQWIALTGTPQAVKQRLWSSLL
jgi:hypothetical protein